MTDQHAYPPPHYAPGWRPPAPPWDGTSIAALVTGALGLGPVAVVLGAVGLRRARRAGRRGRALAGVGLALGVVGILGYALLAGLVWLLLRPLPADVADPRFALATQLAQGNCVASLPPDGDVWVVRVVPCQDGSAAQVVVRADLSDPPDDQRRLDEAAAALCRAEADDVPPGELVVWAPTPGDAAVYCLTLDQTRYSDLSGAQT